jgi:single-strand DNA-binding protein
MNKAIIIGSLGRDPEVRTMNNGNRVVSFSMATSEHWRDKASGERKERTEWHNVVIFNEGIGKVAEQYLRKGSKAYVEGQIQTRKWQDKDGADRYTTEIVIPVFGGALELLDSRKDDQRQPAPQSQGNRLSAQLDDDIPFNMEWR